MKLLGTASLVGLLDLDAVRGAGRAVTETYKCTMRATLGTRNDEMRHMQKSLL